MDYRNILNHCPVVYTMDMIGGRWEMALIWLINEYPQIRYGQIKKIYPMITNTSLTRTLQHLEQSGIISRTDFNENPPRVEYSLTSKGMQFLPVLECITKIGGQIMSEEGKRGYFPNINEILNK
ncbi:HTH-type transcriptional activator HxlR [bioreactor metagenome]|uniref:HTH-type transcriptional activator HxlR n=1 Tax=bioreactor metagenome TaxID=1076179 RepID=A0A644YAX8_9ZZZZ|nr:helix-turn-helix domain-containing protein [Candidatus Metalachnospira sp.]